MKIDINETISGSLFFIEVKVVVELIPFPSVESKTLPKGTPDKVLYRNTEWHMELMALFLLKSVAFLANFNVPSNIPKQQSLQVESLKISVSGINVWDAGTVHKISNGFLKKPTYFKAGSEFVIRLETDDTSHTGIQLTRQIASDYVDGLNMRADRIAQLEQLHVQNYRDYLKLQPLYPYPHFIFLSTRLLARHKPKGK